MMNKKKEHKIIKTRYTIPALSTKLDIIRSKNCQGKRTLNAKVKQYKLDKFEFDQQEKEKRK